MKGQKLQQDRPRYRLASESPAPGLEAPSPALEAASPALEAPPPAPGAPEAAASSSRSTALPEERLSCGEGNAEAAQENEVVVGSDADDAQEDQTLESVALLAWRRIGSRVLNVTAARPDGIAPDHDADAADTEEVDDAADNSPPRDRPRHICLGDMMEESLSWVDLDSEDDCTSPKQQELMEMMAMQAMQWSRSRLSSQCPAVSRP